MVEIQDPDNCLCFTTQEICACKLAAYVFNITPNSEIRLYSHILLIAFVVMVHDPVYLLRIEVFSQFHFTSYSLTTGTI